MGNALKFKQGNVLRQQGEQARLKVVQGPDYGAVFVIVGPRATIGRGEENDVMVTDLKSSRLHAEIAATPNGWAVRDLGSANGILHNGKNVRAGQLRSGDLIVLGETTLEFVGSELGTQMLAAPPRSALQLQTENAAFEAQRQRVKDLGKSKSAPRAAPNPGAKSSGGARPIVILALAAVVGYLVLAPGDPPPKKKPAKKEEESRDLAEFLPQSEAPPEILKTADMLFRAGFREYRQRNYIRARENFENVLQVYPGHRMATLYMQNCNKAIEEEVTAHLEQGKKSIDSGKLKNARAHFESVMRLLIKDQVNPAYIQAKEQAEKLDKSKEANAKEGSG